MLGLHYSWLVNILEEQLNIFLKRHSRSVSSSCFLNSFPHYTVNNIFSFYSVSFQVMADVMQTFVSLLYTNINLLTVTYNAMLIWNVSLGLAQSRVKLTKHLLVHSQQQTKISNISHLIERLQEIIAVLGEICPSQRTMPPWGRQTAHGLHSPLLSQVMPHSLKSSFPARCIWIKKQFEFSPLFICSPPSQLLQTPRTHWILSLFLLQNEQTTHASPHVHSLWVIKLLWNLSRLLYSIWMPKLPDKLLGLASILGSYCQWDSVLPIN